MFENPDMQARCALLQRVKSIAVVGLSPNASRPSHGVAAAMQGFGYHIIPVHPAADTILGAKVYRRLADIPGPIDLVNVFRASEFIDEVVDECIALKLKAVWIQEGIVNEPAALRARAAGMTVVMDRCIYRDYVNECRSPKP
jgi:predicted CoA-binding protein